MSDDRLKSGTGRASRRIAGRAMTVVLSSVVLVGFGASAAWARATPENPPAPTGTVTSSAGGAITVTASGSWTWPVGTGAGELNATAGTLSQECGGNYGVGWGMAWNDPNDTGYTITYKKKGVSYSLNVGSKTGPDGQAVAVAASPHQCGTYSPTAVSGTWSSTHTYAAGTALPSQICVVSYVLKSARPGHKKMYQVNTNRKNSFHTAVNQGNGSLAKFETTPNCFDPASFVTKASPTIVTTATNAQVGSPIADSAVLSGTAQAAGAAVVGNAGGTITFNLYAPSDTTCATSIFSSTVNVNGNGGYGPASFTPTQGAGAYRWVATYSGDPNNNGATEVCGAAGETSTVSVAPATTATNPPTSPTSSHPVVTTSASGTSGSTATQAAVTGATTVHTGEPWAGSKPFVAALIAFGLSLMGLGFFQRRRMAMRKHVEDSSLSTH
jgi:hypothetical protein